MLVWYLPRFLFVSLDLDYSKQKSRLFLLLLVLIGAMKILAINVQATEYWTREYAGFARIAVGVEDIVTLPLLYGLSIWLVVSVRSWRSRPVSTNLVDELVFWSRHTN